jgi:hypothetical protein
MPGQNVGHGEKTQACQASTSTPSKHKQTPQTSMMSKLNMSRKHKHAKQTQANPANKHDEQTQHVTQTQARQANKALRTNTI